ncbi:MAG TPA: hypothetical protein PK395_18790, partial [bacterium]|nr:hypothetical protein [bacterium]
ALIEKAGSGCGIFVGDLPPEMEYQSGNGVLDIGKIEVAEQSDMCAWCKEFIAEDDRCGIHNDEILCQRCYSLVQFLPLYGPTLRRQLRIASIATGDKALEIAPWILGFFQANRRLPDRYNLKCRFPLEGSAFFCDVLYCQQLAIDMVRRENGWTEAIVERQNREMYT